MTERAITAATNQRELDELKENQECLAKDYGDERYEVWERQRLHQSLRSPRYVGAGSDPLNFHIHPLKLVHGMAKLLAQSGVAIFENSAVTKIISGKNPLPHRVTTETGEIKASSIVIATNAYGVRLVPKLNGYVMPVCSVIMVTKKLGSRLDEYFSEPLAAVDNRHMCDYFHPTADGRLLFGGADFYTGKTPTNIAKSMQPRLAKVFPNLSDADIEYQWGGLFALSRNMLPAIGTIEPGIYYAQGYSGHGVALSNFVGSVLAETIAGTTERFDIFSRVPKAKFPGGQLFRTPLLALGMLWYSLLDLHNQ